MDRHPSNQPRRTDSEGVLLERGRELSLLDDLVEAAQAGRPVLALMEGPAGIGKSQLLAMTREKATAAGFRLLTARASDLEREFPFGVVRQLFDPVLLDADQRERWLAGPAAGAARVFEPSDDADAATGVSFDILHGLFWLAANIAAQGPLLLVIDDLHWCDRSSLRFIAYLERRLEGLHILVATASRSGEEGTDARLLEEIAVDPATVLIRPPLLSVCAVTELTRGQLGSEADQAFCAACHRATGGNPLLLAELLKALRAEGVCPDIEHVDVIQQLGPRAVARSVLHRLARLSEDAVAVARSVAVLGDGAGLSASAQLAGLDEPRVARVVHRLAAAEILSSSEQIGFAHPLLRDVVYHDLATSERALAHERAARILMDLGSPPEVVAIHLLLVPARSEPWVADVLQAAGTVASRRGDTDSAVSFLQRALDEPAQTEQRPRLLLGLGTAEALLNMPSAVEHLSEARDHLDDPVERARCTELLVRSLIFTRPPQEAVTLIQQARGEHPPEQVDQGDVLEAIELWLPTFGGPAAAGRAARLAALRTGGLGDGPGAKMLTAVTALDWALGGGTAAECVPLALEALSGGILTAADPVLLSGSAITVLAIADHKRTFEELERIAVEVSRRGSPFLLSGVYYMQGWTWLAQGELVEATDALHRSAEAARSWSSTASGYTIATLAQVLIERGDLDEAEDLLGQREPVMPGSELDAMYREATAALLVARARWQEALEAVDEYAAVLSPAVVNPAWVPWRSLKASALAGRGDQDGARTLLEDELLAAQTWGAPRALSRSLRLLGTLLGGPEGINYLRRSVQVADGSPARLEHAKALAALGSALRRSGQPTQARDPLRAGWEIAVQCGAQPVAERARTELYAAGARPRREASSGPESLTPSERRVATLAATGVSNREIARELYVTPKTVEVHLTSTYRKLGISARAALADALSSSAG